MYVAIAEATKVSQAAGEEESLRKLSESTERLLTERVIIAGSYFTSAAEYS